MIKHASIAAMIVISVIAIIAVFGGQFLDFFREIIDFIQARLPGVLLGK